MPSKFNILTFNSKSRKKWVKYLSQNQKAVKTEQNSPYHTNFKISGIIQLCTKMMFSLHSYTFFLPPRIFLALSAAGHAEGGRVYHGESVGPARGSVARALAVQGREIWRMT